MPEQAPRIDNRLTQNARNFLIGKLLVGRSEQPERDRSGGRRQEQEGNTNPAGTKGMRCSSSSRVRGLPSCMVGRAEARSSRWLPLPRPVPSLPALQHALRSAPPREVAVPSEAAQAANSPVSAINASISLRRSLGLVA